MIAVSSQSFLKNETLKDSLESKFPASTIFYIDLPSFYSKDSFIKKMKPYSYILCGKELFDKEVIDQLPNLIGISKYGVGLDNIDLEYASKKNIEVCFEPGVNAMYVAEQTLGFMIGSMRNLVLSSNKYKSGQWFKNGGTSLFGKTIGIVGLGNVGEALVRLLAPFSCDIIICDIVDKSDLCKKYSIRQVSLECLLEFSDVVTLHVPLDSSTRGMISDKSFQLMKKNSILINTCRGGVVDEKALYLALSQLDIAFACCDVFINEPNINSDLQGLENFWPTAHIAGNAKESVLDMGMASIRGLEKLVIGKNNDN